MKRLIILIIIVLIFVLGVNKANAIERQIAYENTVIQDIIKLRDQKGLGKVVKNSKLVWSGRLKAEQMEKTCRFTHHVYKYDDWIKTFKLAGYKGDSLGEVLARRFNYASNVVPAWIRSPSHYKILVDPIYTQVGIYAYKSKCDNKIWVIGHFGN